MKEVTIYIVSLTGISEPFTIETVKCKDIGTVWISLHPYNYQFKKFDENIVKPNSWEDNFNNPYGFTTDEKRIPELKIEIVKKAIESVKTKRDVLFHRACYLESILGIVSPKE